MCAVSLLSLARQPTKTKLLARISSTVMLVWFVYATKSPRATAQSHAATLSRDKIAGLSASERLSEPRDHVGIHVPLERVYKSQFPTPTY